MDTPVTVRRLGNRVVNFYVVEQAGRFTVVDAGAPRHLGLLAQHFQAEGLSMADIEAVVLTHAHGDHMGFAERLRADEGAEVHVHERDHAHALGEPLPERDGSMMTHLWRPAAWRTIVRLALDGVSRVPPVLAASSFADDETLDVPGGLRVVHAPGHTPGSCALVAPGADTVFTGDVLVTWNPLTGRRGPQVMPSAFNDDTEAAIASLARLESVGEARLLPGHGDPWEGSVGDAVAAARSAGPS